jgi:hypothetical protein
MALLPPFRDLWQRYSIEMLAEAIAKNITTGRPAMPDFALPPRGIDALLSYIDALSPSSESRKMVNSDEGGWDVANLGTTST